MIDSNTTFHFIHACIAELQLIFEVTINCTGGCWHSKFISKNITDIYFKQVIVSQHMKEIYYLEMKKLLFEKTSMHLNQQLPAPHAPNYSVTVKCSILKYFLALLQLGRHVKISGALCIHLGIRNALRNVESSAIFEISLPVALLSILGYLYTEHRNNAFFALYLVQG